MTNSNKIRLIVACQPACGTPSPTPTVSITRTITRTPTHTITSTRTQKPTTTPTITPSITHTISQTNTVTPTTTVTQTITPTFTLTPSVTPTITTSPSCNVNKNWIQKFNTKTNWISLANNYDRSKLFAIRDLGSISPSNIYISNDDGLNWTTSPSPQGSYLRKIISDYSGQNLAVISHNGYIYTSTDSGSNWTQRAYALNWTDIVSSDDGTKLIASIESPFITTAASYGLVYISNDSGVSWSVTNINIITTNTTLLNNQLACSSDGSIIILTTNDCSNGGYMYRSTDGGNTWTRLSSAGIGSWSSISMSGDGSFIIASTAPLWPLSSCGSTSGGFLYLSQDGGTNWSTVASLGVKDWRSVNISKDNNILTACSAQSQSGSCEPNCLGGYIYVSENGGLIWTQQTTIENDSIWTGVTSSWDGTKLAAITYSGNIAGIYTRNNCQ